MKFRIASKVLSLLVLSLLFTSSCSDRDKLFGEGEITLEPEHYVQLPVEMTRLIKILSVRSTGSVYAAGDSIIIEVEFDQAVGVTGTPQLVLDVGGITRVADYSSGVAAKMLAFKYTVVSGDLDADGIEAMALSLNSGKIKGILGNFVDLSFTSPTHLALVYVDGKGPAIKSVSSTVGTYIAGDFIPLEISFDETVDVTGAPQLKLDLAGNTKVAVYASGSGGKTLTFNYQVALGDFDADGIEAVLLSLNSGKIKGILGNDADLSFTNKSSLASVYVDGKGPIIQSVKSTAGTYGKDKVISVKVEFDETVDVTGAPQLKLDLAGNTKVAVYASGSGGKTLTFNYQVALGDLDTDGVEAMYLSLNSGTIQDALGNDANLTITNPTRLDLVYVDGREAVIKSVKSTAGTYGQDKVISVKVEFDETVDVKGSPQLNLDIGGTARVAVYASGSGGKTLTFNYTVALGDFDADGIEATTISLNSATIQDALGNDANLIMTSQFSLALVKVKGRAGIVQITSIPSVYTSGEEIKVLVKFSGPVTVDAAGSEITIDLDVGGSIVQAHHTATNSKIMEFTYAALSNIDLDGIEVISNSIKKGVSASIKSGGLNVIETFAKQGFPNVKVKSPFEFSKISDIWFDSTDVDGDGDTTDQKAGEKVTTFYDKSGKDNHIRTPLSRLGPTLTKDDLNNNNLSLFFDNSADHYLSTSKNPGLSASSHTYFTSITTRNSYETGNWRIVWGTRNFNSGISFGIDNLSRNYVVNIASIHHGALNWNGVSMNRPVNNRSVFMSELNASRINRIYSFSNMSDSALIPVSVLMPGKIVFMGGLHNYYANDIRDRYKGFINEVFYFNKALTLAERSVIENYLASKWNSREAVGRNYYKGDDPSKGDYDYDVTGILKLPAKTVAAKNQNILSQTLPASSVSAARNGALLIANNASDGFLKDEGDSVFAGSKGNGVTKDNLPISRSVSTVRSNKVWCLDVSNAGSAGGKIDLAFTPSLMGFDWTADAASYELLWSASAPTPSVAFEVMSSASSVANGTVRFSGIEAKSGYIALGLKDTVAPSLRYAEVTGDKEITLTFDESIANQISGLSLAANTIIGTNIHAQSTNKIVITTGNSIKSAETLSYSGSAISDIAGNELKALSGIVVDMPRASIIRLTSSSIVVAGAGDDDITASSGSDVFDYNFITDGNDTITGFDKVKDKIDLSDLLQYSNGQDISKFIAVSDDGTNTTINMDAHGRGNTLASTRDISITLSGVLLDLDSLINALVVTSL